MKKKVIASASTDWHVDKDTLPEILDIVKQQCEDAVERGLDLLLLLGDMFTSRISQRQDVLVGMREAFDIIHSYNIKAIMIPGNHDKTDYKSYRSFLDAFRDHPAITLVYDNYKHYPIDGDTSVCMHFLPFFEFGSEAFNKEFDTILGELTGGIDLLFSHMSVEGSVNNDGGKVKGGLKRSQLKDFKRVFLGHYHNTHNIGKNITHIPSLRQNNFGEDNVKGFTLIYDDGSFEFVKPNFSEYTVYQFNLQRDKLTDIIDVANEVQGKGHNRFEITGNRDSVKGFNPRKFEQMGIDVKSKFDDLEVSDEDVDSNIIEVKTWNNTLICDKFDAFCKEDRLPYEEGISLLEEIINKV